MNELKKIVAFIDAKPGEEGRLEELLLWMAERSRAEPGNLRWDVWQVQSDKGRYVLDELYVDDAAVSAHRNSPHFATYLERIDDLAERSSAVLDPVAVA